MHTLTVLLVAFAASGILAGPVKPLQSCATQCSIEEKLNYEPGHTYTYKYETNIASDVFDEIHQDKTDLKVNAFVDIEALEPCDYVLKLHGIHVTGATDRAETQMAHEVMRFPMRFAMQSGRINSVCAATDEEPWVANFKKGILSTFQTSLEDTTVEETDISGTCMSEYVTKRIDEHIFQINKNKDMSTCDGHPSFSLGVGTFSTNTQFEKRLPVIDSKQSCQHMIENGIAKKVTCSELHIVNTMKNDKAYTKVDTSMEFYMQQLADFPFYDYDTRRTDLQYENENDKTKDIKLEDIERILAELHILTENDVRPEVAGLFATLVESMKGISAQSMMKLFNENHNKKTMRFLIDSLPLIGTPESVKAAVELINMNEMDSKDMKIWMSSLSFVQNPTSDMFTALSDLMKDGRKSSLMLSVSSLINKYCSNHDDCLIDAGVQKAIRSIESHLGSNCATSSSEEEISTLISLKALGNAGIFVNGESILKQCYQNDNPMEIRIAAIQAWRKTVGKYDTTHLLNTFENSELDSEIRIAAYLALMNNPTQELINLITDRLTSEGINHVSSFVWSHLSNMKESASPGKEWVKNLISKEFFQKKYSNTTLKFSRFYESSFFLPDQKVGANVESSIVFGSKSFIPRSAMLNFTVDLFGKSTNLFEIGGRIEGYEAYIEKFFGSNGYFENKEIEEMVKAIRKSVDKVSQDKEPELSYYVRMFGNDVLYNHVNDYADVFPMMNFNPMEIIRKLTKDGEIDFMKSFNFIKTEYSIPTISGFPLSLKLDGTATTGIKVNGNFDIKSLTNINVAAAIQPSASVDLDTSMTVDAFVTKIGIKTKSNFHTSTMVDGNLVLDGGKIIDVAFKSKRKQELYSFTNENFKYVDGIPVLKKYENTPVDSISCQPGLWFISNLVEFCSETKYPNYEMANYKREVYQKEISETYVKTLHYNPMNFVFRYVNINKQMTLLLDTPGSLRKNRIYASLNYEDKDAAELSIEFPHEKTIHFSALKNIDNDKKKVYLQGFYNKKQFLHFDFVHKSKEENKVKTAICNIDLVVFNYKYNIVSEFIHDYSAFTTALDLSLNDHYETRKLSFVYNIMDKSLKLNVVNGKYFEAKLNGVIALKGNKFNLEAEGSYNLGSSKWHPLTFKMSNSLDNSMIMTHIDLDIQDILKFFYHYEFGSEHYSVSMNGHYFNIHSFDYKLNANYAFTKEKKFIDLTYTLKIPTANINYDIKKTMSLKKYQYLTNSKIQVNEKVIEYNVELNWDMTKEISAKVMYSNSINEYIYTSNEYIFSLMKLDDTKYKVIYQPGLKHRRMDIDWEYNMPNPMSLDMKGSVSYMDMDSTLSFSVNKNTLKVDFSGSNGMQKMNLIATPNDLHFYLDSFALFFNLDTKIINDNNLKKVKISTSWDKEQDPSNEAHIFASFSEGQVKGSLKYRETYDMEFITTVINNGVEMKFKWDPTNAINGYLTYSTGNEQSVAITVETPFVDYEKQDVRFGYSLSPKNAQVHINLSWGNNEQISFALKTNMESNGIGSNFNGDLSFTNTLDTLVDRVQLSVKHSMTDKPIKTSITGKWSDVSVAGFLNYIPKDDGFSIEATVDSPYTNKLGFIWMFKTSRNSLSTNIDVHKTSMKQKISFLFKSIPEQITSHFLLKGDMLPSSVINAKLDHTRYSNNLQIEGSFGSQKYSLTATSKKFKSESDATYTFSLRIITPMMKAITMNLNVKYNINEKEFVTDFDMTGLWVQSGIFKVHVKGRLAQWNNLSLTTIVKGNDLHMEFKGKLNPNVFEISFSINSHWFDAIEFETITTNKSAIRHKSIVKYAHSRLMELNLEYKTDNEEISLKSSFEHMTWHWAPVKFDFIFDNQLNIKLYIEHIATLEITGGYKSGHFNGKLILKYNNDNGLFEMSSEADITKPAYATITAIKFNKNWDYHPTNFNAEMNLNARKIKMNLLSDVVNLEFSGMYTDEVMYSGKLDMNIKNKFKVTTEISGKYTENEKSIEVSIVSNDFAWTPLTFNAIMKSEINPSIDIKLTIYDIAKLSLQGRYSPQDKSIQFNLEASSRQTNILEFLLKINNFRMAAVKINLPCCFVLAQPITIMWNHDIKQYPYTGEFSISYGEKLYKASLHSLEMNSLNFEILIPTGKAMINFKWNMNSSSGFINVNLESTFTMIHSSKLEIKYNNESNLKIMTNISYGSHYVKLEFNLADMEITVAGTTSIKNWNTIAFKATFHNNLNITLNVGDYNFTLETQKKITNELTEGTLSITTPFKNYDSITIYSKYEMKNSARTIDVKFNLGEKVTSVQAKYINDIVNSREITMQVKTPFKGIETMKMHMTWSFSNDIKQVKFNGNFNDKIIDWKMNVIYSNKRKAKVNSMMTNNMWKTTKLEINFGYDITDMPMNCVFNYAVNGVKHEHNLNINLSGTAIDVKLVTPFTNLEIDGNYKLTSDTVFSNMKLIANDKEVTVVFNIANHKFIPKIELNVRTPFYYKIIKFNLSGSIENRKSVQTLLQLNSEIYSLDLTSNLQSKEGYANAVITLPDNRYNNFVVDLTYDFKNLESIKFHMNMNSDIFELLASIKPGAIMIKAKTPFNGFENVYIGGDYMRTPNRINANGNFHLNDQIYNFDGFAIVSDKSFFIETTSPFTNKLKITGKLSNNELEFTITTDKDMYKDYNFRILYMLNRENASIEIHTPFKEMSYLFLKAGIAPRDGYNNGFIIIHKNSEKFELKGKSFFTKMKSYLKLSMVTPLAQDYTFEGMYDFDSRAKNIKLELLDNIRPLYKFALEADIIQHNIINSNIKFTLKLPKYDTIEVLLKSLNRDDNTLEVGLYLKNILNRDYNVNLLYNVSAMSYKLELKTPFTNYELISLDGKYEESIRTGHLSVIVGKNYVYTAKFTIVPRNIDLYIITPHIFLNKLQITGKYNWTPHNKELRAVFDINDDKFEINGVLKTSRKNAGLTAKLSIPFTSINDFELTAIYNLENTKELFKGRLNIPQWQDWGLAFGYYQVENKYGVNVSIKSPFEGYKNINFNTDVDLSNTDNFINIIMEKEGNKKAISMHGKFVGEEIAFDLKSPFEEFHNLKLHGSFTRSKRSLRDVLNKDNIVFDAIRGFNSFKASVNTPFAKIGDASFEIKRSKKGEFSLDYKRKDNYVSIGVIRQDKKQGIDISIKSEFPAWEYLAVHGKLDLEEMMAYIKGQKNSEKMSIMGKGNFQLRSGTFSLEARTPFEKYNTVNAELNYNARKRKAKLKASSSSSDFNVLIEYNRGLHVNVFVPNPKMNTVIKGDLKIFEGKLNVESRFRFIESFSHEYKFSLGRKIEGKVETILNGVKIVEMELERDGIAGTGHFMLHLRRRENHSMIHYHRKGWETLEFIFERNTKQFKIDINGSGNLPRKGRIDFVITNSFREIPRTVTGHIDVDRTASKRNIILEVEPKPSRVYILNLNYEVSITSGDVLLRITTPERKDAMWKTLGIKWNINRNTHEGYITFIYGRLNFNYKGLFGIKEGDLIFTVNGRNPIVLKWKIDRRQGSRDYYMRFGPRDREVLIKFKGKFDTILNGDVSGAIFIPIVMRHEFDYTCKWSKGGNGMSGSGTFSYGDKSGTHKLKYFRRDSERRAAEFEWVAKSNVNKFTSIILKGKYDLSARTADIELAWDTNKVTFIADFSNFTWKKSHGTANLHLPRIGDIKFTLDHDFTNPLDKTVKAVVKFPNREISYKAHWTRTADFRILNLKVDINSKLFGLISLVFNYDVTDFRNASAELYYKRNDDKNVSITWKRVVGNKSLTNELKLNSHFMLVPNARLFANIDWSDGIHAVFIAERAHRKIELKADFVPNNAHIQLHTPYEKIGNIDANLDFNFKGKKKTASLRYTRKDKILNADLILHVPSKKNGHFSFTMTTPFEIVKDFSLTVDWKNKKVTGLYKRNDVQFDITGTAEIKVTKSSLDFEFTPPGRKKIKIALSYDLGDFISKKSTKPQHLIHVELGIGEHHLKLHSTGYRNSEKIYLEVDGDVSYPKLNTFHLKIDTDLKIKDSKQTAEFKLNDFYLKLDNSIESRNKGFYLRSIIESSLTRLPNVIIGFGKEDDHFILSAGIGKREIIWTVKGKEKFKKGHSGTIKFVSMNKLMKYDVNYGFQGENIISMDATIILPNGEKIQAESIYNSHGVKGRLTTPFSLIKKLRFKRSLTDNELIIDADLYALDLHNLKKGYAIKGEIFGKKIGIERYLNVDNPEKKAIGKFMIYTPIHEFEQIGGFFEYDKNDLTNVITANGELYLPFISKSKIFAKGSLELLPNINCDMAFGLGTYTYTIRGQLNKIEGAYTGDIEINTPHLEHPYVNIAIMIKGNPIYESMNGNVLIEHKYGTYRFEILSSTTNGAAMKAVVTLNDKNHEFSINYVEKESGRMITAKYNDYELNAVYTYEHILKFSGKAFISSNNKKLYGVGLEFEFENTSNILTRMEIKFAPYCYKLAFNINSNSENSNVDLYIYFHDHPIVSTYLQLPKNITNDIIIDFKLLYGESDKHFRFEKVKDNPREYNVYLTLIYPGLSNLLVDTKLIIDKNIEFVSKISHYNYDYVIGAKVASPSNFQEGGEELIVAELYLEEPKYGIINNVYLKATFSPNVKELKLEHFGHFIKAYGLIKYEKKPTGGEVSIMFEPYSPNNKASFIVYYDYREQFKAGIEISWQQYINSFTLLLEDSPKTLVFTGESDLIPTGYFKGEMTMKGSVKSSMKIKINLSNKYSTNTARIKIDRDKTSTINASLDVRTGFRGFRKIKIGGSYNNGPVRKMKVFTNKPILLSAEIEYGSINSMYLANMNVETDVENYEKLIAKFNVPMTKLAPTLLLKRNDAFHNMGVTFINSEKEHEIGGFYEGNYATQRHKVFFNSELPYEFGFEHKNRRRDWGFHMLTDSSFFNLLKYNI